MTCMKALVTGIGGFLGLYIVEQLVARGERVRAFAVGVCGARRAQMWRRFKSTSATAQPLSPLALASTLCFHVAGVAGIAGSWDHFYGINTLGTEHILEGCRQHGVRKLIYTSSPSVTFDGTDQCGVDRSAPYASRWLCHYPHTKALAEQQVLAANGSDGLLTCALRPHLIWGPPIVTWCLD